MAMLENEIRAFLMERGALRVGFATLETLAGGPPSADLTYKLPEAKSAISFAMPLDREKIRATLAKKSHTAFEQNNIEVNVTITKIAQSLEKWLAADGYASKRIVANNNYRRETPGWQVKMPPDISHRYVAVRSGVGSFGWSGNVGIKNYGSAIILGTVVTAAELEPTEPIPESESYCDKCKLCVASCPSGFFSKDKETSVTLGGITFKHSARNSYNLCQLVCGGFSGISRNKKWSTWSPGRYDILEGMNENDLSQLLFRAIGNYSKWPTRGDGAGGYGAEPLGGMVIRLTCGNCQTICFGEKSETKENYRLLTSSGCVVQRDNGEIVVLSPDEAEKEFKSLPQSHRQLYE